MIKYNIKMNQNIYFISKSIWKGITYEVKKLKFIQERVTMILQIIWYKSIYIKKNQNMGPSAVY